MPVRLGGAVASVCVRAELTMVGSIWRGVLVIKPIAAKTSGCFPAFTTLVP